MKCLLLFAAVLFAIGNASAAIYEIVPVVLYNADEESAPGLARVVRAARKADGGFFFPGNVASSNADAAAKSESAGGVYPGSFGGAGANAGASAGGSSSGIGGKSESTANAQTQTFQSNGVSGSASSASSSSSSSSGGFGGKGYPGGFGGFGGFNKAQSNANAEAASSS